jgi:epoxyqueuosine reductase
VQLTRERDFSARDHVMNRKLVELMRMSPAEWDDFSRGSAIRRAGRAGFLRNVAVGLGNSGLRDAVPALAAALSDAEPLVRGHAVWALSEIATAEALAAIAELASSETDPFVRGEVEAALSSVGSAGPRHPA